MSKTRKKNLLCLIFAAICCLFAGFLFGSTTKASAAEPIEPKTFEMVSGASIRITDGQVNGKDMTNGLRFQVKTDAETAALIAGENVKLYAFIAPVGVVDLTSDEKVAAAADNIVGYKSKWLEIAEDSIYPMKEESGEVCYYANAVICNLSSDFYDVQFNAIAIIENGGAYTYAKAVSTSRSLYDVVNNAVLDKYADRIVGDSVAENTKLDYANWYGQGEYPVSPKTAAQYAKYNELKGTTLKNLDIVRQDVLVDNATVTIGGTSYPIDIPSEHGEQEVSVTVDGTEIIVPVTIIDAVLTTFEEFKTNTMFTSGETSPKNDSKYYVLGGDIDAAGQSVSDYNNNGNATAHTEYGKGFAGTIDGRGFSVNNLEYKPSDTNQWRVQGLFGGLVGATVKDITFNISTFGGDNGNFSLFGWNIKDSTFKNVTINIPETCAANLQKGGFFAVQNNNGKFYDVTVNAPGTTILYLLGSGSMGQYATTENVVVDAEEVKYIYDSVTSKQGVIAPRVVTLTGNQDILMTDETCLLDLGSEQTGLTVNSIVCDGENLGTDLSNLDLTAFKTNYAKHGEKTVVVKGVKDSSKIKINVPVTFVTKMIKNENDLRTVVTTITDSSQKSIFGYYKLESDINYSGGFYNSTGYTWTNANNGFRGTLDGNGKSITGFAHAQGLFFVVGNGAVIKNVNFISTRWSGAVDRLFGAASYGATYEDVTIIMKSSDNKGNIPTNHLLFSDACKDNTFTNVTVKVYSDDGITLGDVTTVFGKNFTGNKCSGVKIYCKSLVELGKDSSDSSITKYEEVTVYNTEE